MHTTGSLRTWTKRLPLGLFVYSFRRRRFVDRKPLATKTQLMPVGSISDANEERCRVRQALLDAGVIRPSPPAEPIPPVSEAELEAAAKTLAAAGPLSELVIAERDGR